MTHGYDDQGRQYDSNGQLVDWWTELDAERFAERAKVIVDQFNGYKVHGKSVNGELTQGENIADLGGVKIAYIGLQAWLEKHNNPKDASATGGKFTMDQEFFLSWAQIWRNNIRKENALMRLINDPHSPGDLRVNGPLVHLPEFHTAFDVKKGDPMYREEKDRAEIW